MSRILLSLLGAVFVLGYSNITSFQKPNVILIIGDDISWDDLHCYGNKHIRTPNIDKLAADGMMFTNLYLTSSSCSPSRTSILTGRYPHNTGAAELHTPLPGHLSFFPEIFKNKGYYSALVGKWHEGPETKKAYDTLLVDPIANGDGAENQWGNLLRSRPRDKPFFFWLAPFDAHRPWGKNVTTGGSVHDPLSEITVPPTLVDTKETRQDLAMYYQEIARLDYHIGELQKELVKQGIAENTIIVFMADNGRPFPGSKTRLYDRGIKAPFIVKWPEKIKPNQVCNSLISSIDIAPTLLDAAGIMTVPSIQGLSFLKVLQKPSARFRNYIFAEHNWHDYEGYERAVRTPDFLYLINRRDGLDNGGPIDANQSPSSASLKEARAKAVLTKYQSDVFLVPRPTEELYDCRRDSLQGANVVANKNYSNRRNELRRVLKRWQEETGDTEPTHLTPDWYDRRNGNTLPAKGTRGEMPGAAKNASHINRKGPF